MQYRKLGRTKLRVSTIGFGGGPLQVVNQSETTSLILQAGKLGINLIDIDKVQRETEKKVGLAFQNLKEGMIVSTKSFAVTEKDIKKAVLQSLKNLKLSSIDIYQLHMIRDGKDLAKRLNGSLVGLKKAKSEGKIKFIGFSGHHIPTLIKAVKTNEFDTALIPYNLGHTLANELLDVAKEHDVGIMVMKPLGGGFLVDPKFENERPKEDAKYMTTENALKFILSDKRITTVLVGFQRIKEIEEAVKVGNKKIKLSSKEKLAVRNKVLNFLGDDYCRNCKYCMPCKGNDNLDITEILRLWGYYLKYGYKNNPRFFYNNLEVKADACKGCGECEKKCPYNLPIRKMLKQAHTHLSLRDLEERRLKDEEKMQLIKLVEEFKKELIKKEEEIKQLRNKIGEKEHELQKYKNEILRLERLYKEKEEELKRIYQSKGYRYILSNVWKVSNRVSKK